MTDIIGLRSAMIRKGYTFETLADAIGISRQSMSYKANNIREFKASEIANIVNAIELTPEEVQSIFFTNTVDKKST